MLKIPQSSTKTTGAKVAQDQLDPNRAFGNVEKKVMPRQVLPDLASIEYAGDKAMANAMSSIAGNLLTVAGDMKQRDDELKDGRERAKINIESAKYVVESKKLHDQVSFEARENGYDATKEDSEYRTRKKMLREQFLTNTEFGSEENKQKFLQTLDMMDAKGEVEQYSYLGKRRVQEDIEQIEEERQLGIDVARSTDNVNDVFIAIGSRLKGIDRIASTNVSMTKDDIENEKIKSVTSLIKAFTANQLMKSNYEEVEDILGAVLESHPELAPYVDEVSVIKELKIINKEKEAEIKKEQYRVDSEFMGAFDYALQTGENIPTEDLIRKESGMSDGSKAEALRKLAAHKKAEAKVVEDADYVEKMRHQDPGHFIGDTSKATGKLVDQWYRARSESYRELFNENPIAAYVAITKDVASVGRMPSAFRGQITTLMNSDDPNSNMAGAAIVKTLQQQNPKLVAQDFKRFEKELMVADLISNGVAPEEAKNVAYQFTQMDPTIRKAQMKEARKLVENPTGDIEDAIDDSPILDWDIMGQPPIPEAMNEEYKELYSHFYVAYQGNGEMAKKRAQELITGTWGRTKIDGSDRLMKKSPEQMYASGTGEDGWIYEQFDIDMEEIGVVSDEVTIMVNPKTQYSNAPTYMIWDQNQSAFITDDTNQPLLWKPDRKLHFEQKKELKRLEREAELASKRG